MNPNEEAVCAVSDHAALDDSKPLADVATEGKVVESIIIAGVQVAVVGLAVAPSASGSVGDGVRRLGEPRPVLSFDRLCPVQRNTNAQHD